MYNILSKSKKKNKIISMKLSLVSFRYMYVLKSRQVAVPKFMYMPFVSVHFFRSTGSSAGFFPDKTWSISPRYKKSLKFYLLTQSVNRHQNELDNICCKKFFSKNEIDSSRGWKFWDPFHFVVFLRSFLIGEALSLPLCAVKKTFNISTIFINYKQRVISVYINYGSRPNPRCAFMFHGCITSSDMKYLLSSMTCSSDVDFTDQ